MVSKPADDFPETQVSLIHRIRRGSANDRSQALACFFEDYYPALLRYLVNKLRVDHSLAEELVQDFIVQKVVNDRVLHLADREGKFRKQLLACVKNHFLMSLRKTKRRKEVSADSQPDIEDENTSIQWDEEDLHLLDQTCDQAIVLGALRRMRDEFAHWGIFRDRVLTVPAKSLIELCEKYNCGSKKQASNRITNGQRCLNRMLRDQLSHFRSLSAAPDEVQHDVKSLRDHLSDPLRLAAVMRLLDKSKSPLTPWPFAAGHSIINEEILFVDESSDSAWDDDDVTSTMQEVLMQTLDSFLGPSPETSLTTVGDLIRSHRDMRFGLKLIKDLKHFFNERGRDNQSGFPSRMDVAFTFSLIAKYVNLGGQLDEITSMQAPILIDRLEMLEDKRWIPAELRTINRLAIKALLN